MKSKYTIISQAKSSYSRAQDILKNAAVRNGYPIKKALIEFETMIQWSLINVAAQDGYFLKAELELVQNFTDYFDLALVSGCSWSQFLMISGDKLTNLISGTNKLLVDATTDLTKLLKSLSTEERIHLEAAVTTMCMRMAEIDGDEEDSDAYTQEWLAGVKVFKSFSKLHTPEKKVKCYDINLPYVSSSVTIKLDSVELLYDPSKLILTFTVTNLQHKEIRVWLKDYGIMLGNIETETIGKYKLLGTISGYQRSQMRFVIEESDFNNIFWPADRAEEENLENDECFESVLFRTTYDFGENTDVDTADWIVDCLDVEINYGSFDDNNGDEYEDDPDEDEEYEEDDEDDYDYSSNDFDTSEWNAESILRAEGYTVSQREGLSDYGRQAILRRVISNNKMSKRQVIDHIELQIKLRTGKPMYDIAISKWERDLAFLKNFN